MTTSQAQPGQPAPTAREAARHGDSVVMHETASRGESAAGRELPALGGLILLARAGQFASAYAEHAEGPGRDLDVLLVQRASPSGASRQWPFRAGASTRRRRPRTTLETPAAGERPARARGAARGPRRPVWTGRRGGARSAARGAAPVSNRLGSP
ncbi:hypothetical protein QJS66_18640 [Kocuria rhizophila]|nr:hypothetical protein QJS66_18640 [Kocuria rhizophila]